MPDLSHLVTPAVEGAAVVRHAGAPQRAPDVLPVRPNHPFIYHFVPTDPGNWSPVSIEAGEGVADDEVGTWWLPMLKALPIKPGLMGCRTVPRGANPSRAYSGAVERLREKGHFDLDPDLGYCVAKPCEDPRTKATGAYYMDAWSTPRRKLANRALKFNFDRQRYYRWLLSLIREGVIPAPDPDVVDARQARIVTQVQRREAVAITTLAGDEARAASYLEEVEERLDQAKSAQLPEKSPLAAPSASPDRDPTDPEQMRFAELREAAKGLGWKTGGRNTEELRAIVILGLSPDDAVAEGYDIADGYPVDPEGA